MVYTSGISSDFGWRGIVTTDLTGPLKTFGFRHNSDFGHSGFQTLTVLKITLLKFTNFITCKHTISFLKLSLFCYTCTVVQLNGTSAMFLFLEREKTPIKTLFVNSIVESSSWSGC